MTVPPWERHWRGCSATYKRVLGREPAFGATESLCVAWSESTLEYLHSLSCEDPLTGLASLAHVRTRLAEIYREAENEGRDVRTAHALVVVEARAAASNEGDDHFAGRSCSHRWPSARQRLPGGARRSVASEPTERWPSYVGARTWGHVTLLREYLVDLDSKPARSGSGSRDFPAATSLPPGSLTSWPADCCCTTRTAPAVLQRRGLSLPGPGRVTARHFTVAKLLPSLLYKS